VALITANSLVHRCLAPRNLVLPIPVTTFRHSSKLPRRPPQGPLPPPPTPPLSPPRLLLRVALAQEQSTRETSSWRSSCAAPVFPLQLETGTLAHKPTSISSSLGVVLRSERPAHSLVTTTRDFHTSSPPPPLKMPPSVPQPGPARLKRSAGPDEWLDAAKNCKYLSEHHMKQLCEIVKEFMMEGQKLCIVSDHRLLTAMQNQTYNRSLHP
jgi:hypothetical protein